MPGSDACGHDTWCVPMQPSKQSHGGEDLFRERLDAIIDLKHPLLRLAGLVPWSDFEAAFGRFYMPIGRPAKATRLMVGLHYLKHTYDLRLIQDYLGHRDPRHTAHYTRTAAARISMDGKKRFLDNIFVERMTDT